ncbi:hypothetical protein QOZ80_8AG0627020 [Eleusine coracana subsp. coracana]|nr:hypothetical protein QOZ80_8AG0627020 [Eleusine coracana subsp. coracana]
MGAARMAAPAATLLLLLLYLASVAAVGPGDPHGTLADWAPANSSSAASPCAWAGVSCADGHVEALNLSGMSLSGRLHLGALLALPELRSLDLRGNAFHGDLTHRTSPRRPEPPCALEDVDLSSNALNGTLPRTFLASCSGLRFLNLSRNTLTGGGFPFPASLRRLDMSRNRLSDAGLLNYSLTGCHGVQYLNLSANQFTGGLPGFAPCSGVAILDLSWNLLSGALPARLVAAGPVNLTHLSVAGNNFSGDILKHQFGGCANLTVLDWSYNRLSGMGLPPSLANCRRLETLDLS